MRALKTEDRQFTLNPSQQPYSSRRKRSSQASSELSSSKECLVAEKMENKGKENEVKKKRDTGELKASPKIQVVVNFHFSGIVPLLPTATIPSALFHFFLP